MTSIRSRRPATLAAITMATTAAFVAVPLATASTASAAGSCTLWRSTGGAYTGFAKCTSFDGYPKFQLRVKCSKGAYVYSPKVGMGQTTWASCSSSQGYVAETTVYGKN